MSRSPARICAFGSRFQVRRDATDVLNTRAIELSVSQPREILFAPLLVLLPGFETYGSEKRQALFPGLEYLENESSSSTADLRGPAALRRVPEPGQRINIEFRLRCADDAWRWLAAELSPVRDEQGTIHEYISVLHDEIGRAHV